MKESCFLVSFVVCFLRTRGRGRGNKGERGKGRKHRTHLDVGEAYDTPEILEDGDLRNRCGVETRDALSGKYTVDHRIKMMHAPAATKKKKVDKKRAKVSYASWNQRQGDTYGESGIRSLMDINRSSMSAVWYEESESSLVGSK